MANAIRQHCDDNGPDFAVVAKRCETTVATLSRVDRGLQHPGRDLLVRIMRETGLSSDEILGLAQPDEKSADAPALAGEKQGAAA